MALFYNVVKTMPCLPPMTGNGKHTTFKNGDDWGIRIFSVPHLHRKKWCSNLAKGRLKYVENPVNSKKMDGQ